MSDVAALLAQAHERLEAIQRLAPRDESQYPMLAIHLHAVAALAALAAAEEGLAARDTQSREHAEAIRELSSKNAWMRALVDVNEHAQAILDALDHASSTRATRDGLEFTYTGNGADRLRLIPDPETSDE